MIGATLFSGIGAPEAAMPHWQWPWHAEIEKFPAAVMAARHPGSRNLGDVTADDFAERADQIARPDVLVFGSPCDVFRLAGAPLGLDGARGNLALLALAIVGRLRPRWFVFENVPGLLSNWSGGPQCPPEPGSEIEGVENSDFAAFLSSVDELRYFGAWASLDAQFFGLAQRRDRLFFVGHSGDWRYPAAVLFEPESLCGYSAPRHETRQEIAGAIGAGSKRSGQRVGRREAAAGQIVAGTITSAMGRRCGQPNDDNPADYLIASTLNAGGNGGRGGNRRPGTTVEEASGNYLIAFGGAAPDAIDVATARNGHGGPHGRLDFESETFVAHTLRSEGFDAGADGTGSGTPLIAFDCKAGGNTGFSIDDLPGTLQAHHGGRAAVLAYDDYNQKLSDVAPTSVKGGNNRHPHAFNGAAVRRLMPVECERLQGFPDDYTLIEFRGKPAADGPRYKAIGNSMAVPVMRWILSRIERLGLLLHGPGAPGPATDDDGLLAWAAAN